MDTLVSTRGRGRPPKPPEKRLATRDRLIRTGLAVLTEQGFSNTGLDLILKKTGIPKGSFYYYFASKEAFGHALIAAYAEYFNAKLDHWLTDARIPPETRIRNFMNDAISGMARYEFRRGCLIGNLGHELAVLPEGFREALRDVMAGWEHRMANCLAEIDHNPAKLPDTVTNPTGANQNATHPTGKNQTGKNQTNLPQTGHTHTTTAPPISPARAIELAAFFWIGWEGAVLRARLEQNAEPLETFGQLFMTLLQQRGFSHV